MDRKKAIKQPGDDRLRASRARRLRLIAEHAAAQDAVARMEAALRGESCRDDKTHEWRHVNAILFGGKTVDMRKFGGDRHMAGWQLWECLACECWGFATYLGELLRVITAEEAVQTESCVHPAMVPSQKRKLGILYGIK